MTTDSGQPGTFFYVLEDAVRILFVDDDPIMREFAQVHLATEQAEVVVGADGLEALQAIRDDTFDIVLMDLEMPNMDGFEALTRLRADERTRHLPVVVVTGREDVTAIDRAFQAGATSFLVKPINWRLLSYQVRYVHRTHRNEMAMVRRTEDSLKRLAIEAMPLLQQAMLGPPTLRSLAADYVALLEETAGAIRPEEELRQAG